jgi:hypothetical protein
MGRLQITLDCLTAHKQAMAARLSAAAGTEVVIGPSAYVFKTGPAVLTDADLWDLRIKAAAGLPPGSCSGDSAGCHRPRSRPGVRLPQC